MSQTRARAPQSDNRRDDRGSAHDHRSQWRDTRKNARWDAKVHNGYYVRDDNTGDIILAAIATGVIVPILSN